MKDNLELPAACLYTPILQMDKEYLNIALKYFLFETRKQNGSEYPANSVYALFAAIQSALRENGTVINLFEDDEFIEARKSLDAAMPNLSQKGLGSSSRKMTETISCDKEELLWKNGSLDEDSPRQLLDTILYIFFHVYPYGLNFTLRGGKEHWNLRLFWQPQITGPHVEEKRIRRRYLLYKEDVSKTNHGGLKDRKVPPKKVRRMFHM
ncbi:uncharacterized protein KIAA1958-like [Haliotis cracherodii]|uniref:uncharacterized protein KIAA1958-like n=1 Tax=Haliotis cracherodii TaxID=6455 RepID=UPI0039EB3066